MEEENFNAPLLKQHELLGFHLNWPSDGKEGLRTEHAIFFPDLTLGGTMGDVGVR